MCIVICTLLLSRPARGAWVEISTTISVSPSASCRAPQGARGLKFCDGEADIHAPLSRPARGAWVEIFLVRDTYTLKTVAPRKGRVG